MPMAMIALIAPGPKIAVIMIADSSAGNANTTSLSRISASSNRPPRAAAHAPSGTPMPMPIPTATSATAIEFLAPTITMERMSRPKWSVPNQ